jgi:glycosyltransferase involved in cell wall biosynthesis
MDKCDFEIIVIDNYCSELEEQFKIKKMERDRGSHYMSGLATSDRPWLKYVTYDKKLSHWQAKNKGVSVSDGEFLWFCDSHCVPSQGALISMFTYYKMHHKEMNGSVHLPLSYMLEKPGLELIYKLVTDMSKAVVHYSFTRYREPVVPFHPYEVPAMSTCGMMMTRELYNELGGWPVSLGIYGGGENFINFTLSILGKKKWIYPERPLYHYAAPRGYYWNYNDFHRNRCCASYMYGGKDFAKLYMTGVKGSQLLLQKLCEDVVNEGKEQREMIEKKQVITIQDWVEKEMQSLAMSVK